MAHLTITSARRIAHFSREVGPASSAPVLALQSVGRSERNGRTIGRPPCWQDFVAKHAHMLANSLDPFDLEDQMVAWS